MSDIIDTSHPRYSWPPKPCLTPDSLYTTKISPDWIEINVSFPRSNRLTLTEPEAIDLDNRLHRAVEIAIAGVLKRETPIIDSDATHITIPRIQYEALLEALEYITEHDPDKPGLHGEMIDVLRSAVAAARDAIAKAAGDDKPKRETPIIDSDATHVTLSHDRYEALVAAEQELERTKDDLRRVQSVYDFAKLAQEVERLKEQNNSKIGAIECLKNEVWRANKRISELKAERDEYKQAAEDEAKLRREFKELSGQLLDERAAIRTETIEECKKAIVNVRFGPPSNWGGDRPRGWHLDRPCTPKEASHHDNGCNDAFRAVSALATAADQV